MLPWQKRKSPSPGFGISRGFYLSALCSKASLPSVFEVCNPRSEFGAVEGFGVPLVGGEGAVLRQPLNRGAYAIATKDRRTVLRMLVLSKEEAGFDPEAFARSPLGAVSDPELVARVRATWTLAQLTFESHDPAVYPAMDFMLGIAQRMAVLTDGVVADPTCRRYLLPNQVFHSDRVDPRIDARDHVVVEGRSRADGWHSFTLGLQKTAMPELEIVGLLPGEEPMARRFLMVLSQSVLQGALLKSGDRIGSPQAPFEVREGGFERDLWEGIDVLELLPPTTMTAGDSLRAWHAMLSNSGGRP